MKKVIKQVFILGFLFYTLMACFIYAKIATKPNQVILCAQLHQTNIRGLKSSMKKTEDGAIVVITSSFPSNVDFLKMVVAHCTYDRNKSAAANANQVELLVLKDIDIKIVNLNNGVKIDLQSKDEYLVRMIHRLQLPQNEDRKKVLK
jgi:hypothetical protein